jgi:hypothetical protein
MVYKEYNLRAGVYKVQTFGTTQSTIRIKGDHNLVLEPGYAIRGGTTSRSGSIQEKCEQESPS